MIKQILNEKGNVPVKIWTNDIENEAKNQLINLSKMPFIHKHIAVMPDVHAGKGSTIGTVIATKGAIIPSAIGVDIGCGMSAIKLPFKVDLIIDKLPKIRSSIEKAVPVGFNYHSSISLDFDKYFNNFLGCTRTISLDSKELKKAKLQCGTLGGGNHFIEICADQFGDAWLMLHSGSRGIGKILADIHINGTKDLMQKYFIDLPDPDLAYLVHETPEFNDYISDMEWAQKYAKLNREKMVKDVLRELSYYAYGDRSTSKFKDCLHVDCHHNYTQIENHFGSNVYVTRKGAVSARKDQLGIIPGSMGAKSFIVRGLGNQESFCSCSHGAGRKMSRNKARETFTQEDLINQTKGIECRKDSAVIDEIPSAYKDINLVMDNQSDLVKIEYTLKQLICIKG